MKTFKQVLEDIEKKKKEAEFLPTGFEKIDKFLDGGFMKKELIVLGAPTGKGKSLVAGQIFYNIAKEGFDSAYFSLEISNEMVVSRILGAEAGLKPTRVMVGLLTLDQLKQLNKAKIEVAAYDNSMFFYDDLYVLTELEKEIKEKKYEFVVIDFIQTVIAKGEEYERLSFIALSLQRLAKEANCTIFILSQLSNIVSREKRDDIVEYRGSGTIATVCDLGFFLEVQRPEDEDATSNNFLIKLRKNRRGISGVAFSFMFDHNSGNIIEL